MPGGALEWVCAEDSPGTTFTTAVVIDYPTTPPPSADTRFHAVLYADHGSVTASNAGASTLNRATHTMAGPDSLATFAAGRYLYLVTQTNDVAPLRDALASFVYTPAPGFSGHDTVTLVVSSWAGDSALPLRQATKAELQSVFKASFHSRHVSVTSEVDVPVLFTPGYLFIRELEETKISELDLYHQDPDASLTVAVSVGLGKVSLDDQNAAGVVVNGGTAPAWPVTSFSFKGSLAAAMAALHGIVFHATECGSVPGQCDVQHTELRISASDANGGESVRGILVDITCIAEVPLLNAPDAVGDEREEGALAGIPLFITAGPADPAELVQVVIKDVPSGATFTNGKPMGVDWKLDPTPTPTHAHGELTGLEVLWIPDSHDDFDLTIVATAFELSNGDVATNTHTMRVVVNSVNDQPDIVVPGTQVGIEDTVSKVAAASISDVKDLPYALENDYRVTITALHGTVFYGLEHGNESITAPPSCAGLGLVACTGFGTASVRLRGTMAHINAALGTIWYLGDHNFDRTDTLSYEVDDLFAYNGKASDATAMIVTPVNDPPVLTIDSSYSDETGCTDGVDHPNLENRTCWH